MAEDKDPAGEPFDGILIGSMKDWVKGRALADLETCEVGTDTLIAETILRYHFGRKEVYEEKVWVKLPTTMLLMKARVAALDYVAKEAKRDPAKFDEKEAVAILGESEWAHVERLFIFERILFKRRDAKKQYMLAHFIDECHPTQALLELDGRIGTYRAMLDRRLGAEAIENEPIFWAVTHGIAAKGNLGPLVFIAGREHESYIVSLASRLVKSQQKESLELSSPS